MSSSELLRTLGPLVAAVVAALGVDRSTAVRGLLPPAFHSTSFDGLPDPNAIVRRTAAVAALAIVFWIGIFAALGVVGAAESIDYSSIPTSRLFLLHALFAVALVVWYALGFRRPAASIGGFGAQMGLAAPRPLQEIGLGLVAGLGAWLLVMAILVSVGQLVFSLGGDQALPSQPPPVVPWIAGLPLLLRLGLSISAGIFEEAFFRGFLQPRVGLPVSSLLFVLAHTSYEQPFLLLGVALLSVIFGLLVVWRQSIVAAIVAHATFDAIQLLIVIPTLLRFYPA